MRDSDKAQARAGHLPTQVLVGVKKYYSIKWRGNPGCWKLGPFCCQMILPTFFVWLAMIGWPSDELRLKEHRQSAEHMAMPVPRTLFDPLPISCNGFDLDSNFWTSGSSPIFDPPPFRTFLNKVRCGSLSHRGTLYDECMGQYTAGEGLTPGRGDSTGGGLFYWAYIAAESPCQREQRFQLRLPSRIFFC